MSNPRTPRLQRDIERLLDDAGLSYRIESGKKHRKLFIDNEMVMVFSHGAAAMRDLSNLKSLIRRKRAAC